MFMLVVLDPPVRSTLHDGSIVCWQGGDNRYRLWLLLKLDDGRTVGVGSQRMLQPTKGERVVLHPDRIWIVANQLAKAREQRRIGKIVRLVKAGANVLACWQG